MTCLAWANSIGDYMSITNFAKRGRAATAVSGIFSGQLFNFLIGFGASLLIQSLDGEF
jgi:Ca2+/Na+ antiporter